MTVAADLARLRHRPALVLLAVLVLPTTLAIGLQLAVLASIDPTAAALCGALGVGVAALGLAIVRPLGRGAVTRPVAGAALAWGGLAAPLIAAMATAPWSVTLAGAVGDPSTPWSERIVAGPVEEPAKLLGLALLAVAWPGSVRGARAGLVAGMVVGLGFEVIEDILYGAGIALAAAGTIEPTEAVGWIFAARVAGSGLFLHVAFTGLAGAAFGWALERPSAPRLLALGATLAGVAALHALANAGPFAPPGVPWSVDDLPAVAISTLVRSLPLLAVVVLALRLSPDRSARSAP
jgi:RsiW-degrading membrane proteinase PrsW (M82 family)